MNRGSVVVTHGLMIGDQVHVLTRHATRDLISPPMLKLSSKCTSLYPTQTHSPQQQVHGFADRHSKRDRYTAQSREWYFIGIVTPLGDHQGDDTTSRPFRNHERS